MSSAVRAIVKKYDMLPHPEGGYYTQTYKSETVVDTSRGPRASATAIQFLVPAGSVSRLHRLESDEVWHFHSGGPMTVVELDRDASLSSHQARLTILGPCDQLQHVVKAGTWFGCYPNAGTEYALVSCTVSPGFEYEDFELASPATLKKEFPRAVEIIDKLTKGLPDNDSGSDKREVRSAGGGRGGGGPSSNSSKSVVSNKNNTAVPLSHPAFRVSTNEKPRQLILSFFLFLIIIYFGWSNTEMADDQKAVQFAITFIFLAFQMFVLLQVRDLLVVWPHPGFWRLVFGAGAMYSLILVGMLMMDFTRARWILEALLGDIGTMEDYERKTVEVAEVMSSCHIDHNNFMSVLYKQIFGAPWFLSHALGWMGKMMIFRDWKVCLIAALFFEFTEMTLCYVCPEFTECWWDSIFLDVFGANLLGMWMGTYVNRWMVAYSKQQRRSGRSRGGIPVAGEVGAVLDWAGKEERGGIDKISSLVNPMIYDSQYTWSIFKNPLRLFHVIVLIGVMLFVETNTFLMMNTMGIPHDSWYNKARLALFGFMAIPAAAEWYVYVEQTARAGTDVARIGPACWLCLCTALLENGLFWKFFPKHFVAEIDKQKLNSWIPIPTDTLVKHLLFWFLFLLWAFLRYKVVGHKVQEEELDEVERRALEEVAANENKDTKRGKGGKKNKNKSKVKHHKDRIALELELQEKEKELRLQQEARVPDSLKDKIFKIELVDLLLYLSVVPLLFLGTNWKFE